MRMQPELLERELGSGGTLRRTCGMIHSHPPHMIARARNPLVKYLKTLFAALRRWTVEPHSRQNRGTSYLDLPSCAGQLYWLAYTLTGDEIKARSTFQATIDELLEGSTQVFQHWVCRWARRLVIKASVAILQADVQRGIKAFNSNTAASLTANESDQRPGFPPLTPASLQGCLLQLDIFPRFAFILRTLEGYSPKEAALLLNVDPALSEAANVYAISFLSAELRHPTEAVLNQQRS